MTERTYCFQFFRKIFIFNFWQGFEYTSEFVQDTFQKSEKICF